MSRRIWAAGLLAAASVAATVAAAEIVLRLRHGGLAARPTSNASVLQMAAGGSRYPSAYHLLLGYVPRATVRHADPRARHSFAFGDEVDDADTWPAQLEALVSRPVLNGGVFGYGLDQIVLRGELLLARPAHSADTVILSVLPEDVLRCEFSYRYAWKPYFTLEGGQLALRNVPAPRPHEGPPGERLWRRVLRHSFVADRALRLLDPDGWAIPDSVRVHRDGAEVARRLIDRWADAVRHHNRSALLVVQWSPQMVPVPIESVVARAHEHGIPVLDLRSVLEPAVRTRGIGGAFELHLEPGRPSGVGHMNAQGNRIAAEAIAAALPRPTLKTPADPL